MRRLAIFLVVASAVLAGCLGPFEPEPDDSANAPPTVELTAATTVYLGDSVEASFAAIDPEGDPLEWIFEIETKPAGSSITALDVSESLASFTPDELGEYVIRVTVSDGDNEVVARVTITVIDGAPEAPSGPQPDEGAVDVGVVEGLEWADAPGASSYEVFLGAGTLPGSPTATVTDSSFAPAAALDYSTTYRWQIVAVNSYGSTAGPQWSFTTQDEPLSPAATPSGPAPANGATGLSRNANLEWNDATDAAGYDIQWREAGGSWNTVYDLTQSSYDLPQLAWNTEYEWRVTATNATGDTAGPVWRFATIVERSGPFSLQSPTNAATRQGVEIELDWSESARAENYDVYFGTTDSPPFLANVEESFLGRTGLERGTTYYWRVVAKNAGGSRQSGQFTFRTELNPPATPANPSPQVGADEALPGLTLGWASSQYATSYDVYLRTGRASFSLVASGITSSSFTPTGLDFGRSYEWYVVAHNAEHSTTGPTWSFTTQNNNLSSQMGGYWTFDATLGDSSGFGHDGTWYPQPAHTHVVPGSSPTFVENRHGEARSAVAFTSTYSQYVRVSMEEHAAGPLNNHANGFSLSLWFYDWGGNESARLVSKRYPSSLAYELDLNSGDRAQFVRHGSVAASILNSEMIAGWNHIAVSWDFSPARLRIWINGTLTEDYAAEPFQNSVDDLFFGRNGPGNFFTGYLDDIRIYYRAISPTEVNALFNE